MLAYGFSDTVLRAVYRFFGDWEAFIRDRPAGPDRQFHEQALRLSKGLAKAYRTWREDRGMVSAQPPAADPPVLPSASVERVKQAYIPPDAVAFREGYLDTAVFQRNMKRKVPKH